MSDNSGSSNGEQPPANGEVSHDALGDTHLGRSLKELIKEIGKEKEALQKGLASDEASGSKSQDSEDFDPSQTRFDRALELAASTPPESESADGKPGSTETPPPSSEKTAAATTPAKADANAEILQAMTGMEELLRRFAEAERRRFEQELAHWKVQLKKATMIVIKKQVDNARARWMQNRTAGEAKVAEHYKRLKALADKVAKQKAQIQKAKQELESKLEVADRLHNEFDEIRNVLDGQIGAIDAIDKNDGPAEK